MTSIIYCLRTFRNILFAQKLAKDKPLIVSEVKISRSRLIRTKNIHIPQHNMIMSIDKYSQSHTCYMYRCAYVCIYIYIYIHTCTRMHLLSAYREETAPPSREINSCNVIHKFNSFPFMINFKI